VIPFHPVVPVAAPLALEIHIYGNLPLPAASIERQKRLSLDQQDGAAHLNAHDKHHFLSQHVPVAGNRRDRDALLRRGSRPTRP